MIKTSGLAHAAAGWDGDRFGAGGAADVALDASSGAALGYAWWRVAAGRWAVEAGVFAAYDGLPDPAPRVALGAGVHAAARIAPWLAVFTGAPWQPAAAGRQLTLITDNKAPRTFDLPLGLAITGRVDAYVMTTVLSVTLAHGGAAVIGQRLGVPLAAGARYHATRVVDIGAEIAGDTREVGDTATVLITVGITR